MNETSPSAVHHPVGADWELDAIVGRLRTVRDRSLAVRQRSGRPVKLPSRSALLRVVEGLRAAFFPHRLSMRELVDDSVDFFVGRTLDAALCELRDQTIRELRLTAVEDQPDLFVHRRATELIRRFAAELPNIRTLLESDLQAAFHGDAAARSIDEVLAYYPGITAVTHHRLAHELYRLELPLVARIVAEIAHAQTGIDIHPGASIGEGIFIDHGTGVVVGETTTIGRRVRIYHGVTLGAAHPTLDDEHVKNPRVVRHPTIEDDVVLYAGATVLGPIRIGRGSVIGGNVCVTQGVGPGSRLSQARLQHEDFGDGVGI